MPVNEQNALFYPNKGTRHGHRRTLTPTARDTKPPCAVFDKARVFVPNGEVRIGLAIGGAHAIEFRRNARDRHVAKQNVTAILMGDPAPDRVKW